jgi:hypothetical protein
MRGQAGAFQGQRHRAAPAGRCRIMPGQALTKFRGEEGLQRIAAT